MRAIQERTRVMRCVATCVATASLLTTGCADGLDLSSLTRTCEWLNACDEPTPPPESVDVVCDTTIGSSCTRETMIRVVDASLQYAIKRPGSRVRAWAIAKTVAETNPVGEREVPPPPHGSARAKKAIESKLIETSKEYFMTSMAPAFAAPGIRRSPLFEAVGKVALADSGMLPRRIVIVTDAREVSSLGDFECGLLPSDAGFVKKLHRRRILPVASLTGVSVELAFVQSTAVPARGCPVQLEREMRIRELWRAALLAAGAKEVNVRTGPPLLQSDEQQPMAMEAKETKR